MADTSAPSRVPRGGPEDWITLALDRPLFANLTEDAVVGHMAAIENGFINELGGHTRFPGLVTFADFSANDNGRVYLNDFEGDLIAATSRGQVYRVREDGTAENATKVPISGGRRVIIAKSDKELFFAAGGPIISLRGKTTELLSAAAPLATHVGWIDGYTLANEINSQRWFWDDGSGTWDPLDTESADGAPGNINSMIITPFREILFGASAHIEQFERYVNGTVPFFRRWAIGDGVQFPYCMTFADNAVFTINKLTQFVRFQQQTSQNVSADIGLLLEQIDDWTDAWLGGYPDSPLNVIGQAFLVLQAPNATTPYGTKGVTIVYDYRGKKFFTIYGWDEKRGVPTRWPGWSHWKLWGKTFVGGQGKIYQLTTDTYTNDGILQRWLVRTSHIAQGNEIQIKDFRLQLVRGRGSSNARSTIRVRCRRNAKKWGPWITRDLGYAGDAIQFKNFGCFGNGTSFMWDISSADDVPIDLKKAEVKAAPLGH
jgi:hypothetical protein